MKNDSTNFAARVPMLYTILWQIFFPTKWPSQNFENFLFGIINFSKKGKFQPFLSFFTPWLRAGIWQNIYGFACFFAYFQNKNKKFLVFFMREKKKLWIFLPFFLKALIPRLWVCCPTTHVIYHFVANFFSHKMAISEFWEFPFWDN